MARFIAYYLPQFYPIPLNNKYWGEGFTEWTRVKNAKPLFRGHYQPFQPTELGYYDLRNSEIRIKQACLARENGIFGFCYWHYWFGGGKRVLELPFNEVLASGEPDFPFCLCWANHSWTKTWEGKPKEIIVEQTYPGVNDYIQHFYALLPAFKDKRYIKVNGKLLFSIFAPQDIPDCSVFVSTWRTLADKENLPGFHFIGIGVNENMLAKFSLDASTPHTPHYFLSQIKPSILDKISYKTFHKSWIELKAQLLKKPRIISYNSFVKANLEKTYHEFEYPVILPNWDHTPRSRERGFLLFNSSPDKFKKIVQHALEAVKNRTDDNKIIFIKAWNEWAEGNFLEPELLYGRGYLEVIKENND